MADELVDIYDENNRPLGDQRMRSEAHREGLWHRASHVWIYNSKGEMLLQLRGKELKMYPDLWDISAAGHVGAGQSPIDAALRETEEELGLAAKAEDLEFVRIQICHKVFNGLVNNEFQYAYFLRFEGSIDSLNIQRSEVQAIKFLPIKQIEEELLAKPEKYVPHKEYWTIMLSELDRKLNPS